MNYTKYCFKGCEASEKWSKENEDIVDLWLSHDGDYYWINEKYTNDNGNDSFDINCSSGVPEDMEEITWKEYKRLFFSGLEEQIEMY